MTAVQPDGQAGFLVHTATGQAWHTAGLVAATGSFGRPYRRPCPARTSSPGGCSTWPATAARTSTPGERVVVVGAGNSAVQVGYELAQVATVTLATRHPVAFRPQCRAGRTCTTG